MRLFGPVNMPHQEVQTVHLVQWATLHMHASSGIKDRCWIGITRDYDFLISCNRKILLT